MFLAALLSLLQLLLPAQSQHNPPTCLRKGIFGTDPAHLGQRCCAEAQNSPCTAAAAGRRRAKTPRNTQAPGASQPVRRALAQRAAALGPALAQILPSQKATPALRLSTSPLLPFEVGGVEGLCCLVSGALSQNLSPWCSARPRHELHPAFPRRLSTSCSTLVSVS